MNIEIAYEQPILTSVHDLRFFQGDLKELSEINYQKLRQEIINTGFAFAPHVWIDCDQKIWLIDGHQRILTMQRLATDGYTVPNINVIPVKATDIHQAKRRVLQATSQYGKITNQGLANFAFDSDILSNDLVKSFELPNIDLTKFHAQFVNDGRIINIAAHERVVGLVNGGTENSEWVSMPQFEAADKDIKLIIIFKTEEARDLFCKEKGINITNVNCGQWTSRQQEASL